MSLRLMFANLVGKGAGAFPDNEANTDDMSPSFFDATAVVIVRVAPLVMDLADACNGRARARENGAMVNIL